MSLCMLSEKKVGNAFRTVMVQYGSKMAIKVAEKYGVFEAIMTYKSHRTAVEYWDDNAIDTKKFPN